LLHYTGGGKPAQEHMVAIRDAYAISLEWLLNAKGEPNLAGAEKGIAHQGDHLYNVPELDYISPSSAQEETAGAIDITVLEQAIELLEKKLIDINEVWTPREKAEYIADLYYIGYKAGLKGAKERMARHLRLVS